MRRRAVTLICYLWFGLSCSACGSDDDDSSSDGDATGGSGGGGVTGTGGGGVIGTGGGGGTGGGATSGGTAGGPTGGGGSPGGCEPVDVSSYEPPPYKHARPASTVCTIELVEQYYDACHGGGAGCDAFGSGGEHEACGACLAWSFIQDDQYGPLTNDRGYLEINPAGCLELVDGNTDCAQRAQAAYFCLRAACHEHCPIGGGDLTPIRDCKDQARTGVCASYEAAAACYSPAANAACVSSGDFRNWFVALGKVFCIDG